MFPELTRDEVFMIGTKRLWLRWPRLADAGRLAAINGHPDVASMTASWKVGYDEAFARDRIVKMRTGNAAGSHLTLVIAKRGDWFGTVGTIGVGITASATGDAATNTLVGHLGYALDPAAAGQGLMSEAVCGLINMVRLLTKVDRVEAGVMPHNPASMRLLQKAGFARGDEYTHDSPIKGPIEVIRYTRILRAAPAARPVRRSLPKLHTPLEACA
jgi:RimJ/RimL family protein N-acetyltransferase